MKSLRAKDLQDKPVDELEGMLLRAQADLYQLRRDLVFRKVSDISSVRVRRHDIARIKTVLTQKSKEASA